MFGLLNGNRMQADSASGSQNVGTNGNYWSATEDATATNARNLNFNDGNLNVNPNNKENCFSVRLFREESATVRRARSLIY